jgi:branched-chain amino acid transport system permease protein
MEYFVHLLIMFGIYAILGMSLNLVVGYSGLLSLCQAAFYGIGAYTTALLLINFQINFFLVLFLGMVVSGFLAVLIGIVLSRFKSDYYALGSLGFNVIIFSLFLNWQGLTRGPLGLPGLPRPTLFGWELSSNLAFLIFTFFFLGIVYFLSRFIVNSPFGRVLKAIREDEKVIEVFGYSTFTFKLTIFVISAIMASVAGSLFAVYLTFIDPYSFTLMESIFILAIIILGGLANLEGSLLGALFLILLPEFLRFLGFPQDIAAQMRQLIYGILLILLMLYRPQGLLGEYKI